MFGSLMGSAFVSQQHLRNVLGHSTSSAGFSSAADVAQQYPQYSQQIIAGAKSSFLGGADWAYTAGIIAVLCTR